MAFGFGFGLPMGGNPQWSPASLFYQSEPGAWYDPSDLSTLYQDAAGTTPVTAVEQSVGLMLDKSKFGPGSNGAARYNLLTYSEQFNNAAWSTTGASVSTNTTTAPNGTTTADTLVESSANSEHAILFATTPAMVSGVTYTASIYVNFGTWGRQVEFRCGNNAAINKGVLFSATGAFVSLTGGSNGTIVSYASTNVGSGWFRLTIVFTSAATTSLGTGLTIYLNNGTSNTYTGDGTSGVYIWGADLRLSSQAALTPTYQPITATWYDTMPGNHAYTPSASATSRPVLSARYNLLTKTEQFDDVAWTKTNITVTPNSAVAPDGTITATTYAVTTSAATISWQNAVATSTTFAYTIYVKQNTGPTDANSFAFFNNTTATVLASLTVNYSTGAVTHSVGSGATTTNVGNGWWRLSVPISSGVTVGNSVRVYPCFIGTTETAGKAAFIWGADLRVSNEPSTLPYQRVNTSTDYDTVGFPLYLKADGVDDYMQTNSINFTATDKMTVWAGVRKLSDAATGMFTELSADLNANNGAFYVLAPNNPGSYAIVSKGTLQAAASNTGYTAPITNVLTGISSISVDSLLLRVNGTQIATSAADQGTGNYGNYPLYLFRRAGTSLPFNGRFYGMTVLGAATNQIVQGETYLNQKMGLVY